MKSSNKLLAGFGAVILALVVVAVVLVQALPGASDIELPPEDTPEGVVMRYFKAIGEEDFITAGSYLTEEALEQYPFIKVQISRTPPRDVFDIGWKASIVETKTVDSQVTVYVDVSIFRPGEPFDNPIDTYREQFILVEENGTWKIQGPAGFLWYLY
ncbi:MAG: hypothetical protein JW712_05945 [Dehalococcoidales bacterium]|nr:hypothetical protein [Dehalococcoidales bacterium]